MYVAVIPNRGSPPAILLRESYREAGKTKNRTLANLSRWPAERIAQLRAVLRGDQLLPAADAVEIGDCATESQKGKMFLSFVPQRCDAAEVYFKVFIAVRPSNLRSLRLEISSEVRREAHHSARNLHRRHH